MMIRFSHVTISMSTSFDCRNSTTTNQANLYIYTKNTLIRTRLKNRTRKCDITKCFIISKYIKISHVKASNHTPTVATALSLLCIYLLPWAGYVKKGLACMVWINGFVTHAGTKHTGLIGSWIFVKSQDAALFCTEQKLTITRALRGKDFFYQNTSVLKI